jgi:broad specificity phosphatase PhoE
LYAPGKVAWDTHPVDLLALEGSITLRDWPSAVVYGEHLAGVLQPFYATWDAFLGEHGHVSQGLRYRVKRRTDVTLAFFCHAGVTLSLLAHLLHIAPPLVYAHFGCDPSSVTILESDNSPRQHASYGF